MKITTGTNFPAGTYWIGDPCYIIPNNRWSDLLDASGYFYPDTGKVSVEFDGNHVGAFSTLYGDGTYPSNTGNYFSVDSGLIGLVSLTKPENLIPSSEYNGMGLVVNFPYPFFAYVDSEGTLYFDENRVIIWTGGLNDDENESDYYVEQDYEDECFCDPIEDCDCL